MATELPVTASHTVTRADVMLMAGFVALSMARDGGNITEGEAWLASVADEPEKWVREASAFQVLTCDGTTPGSAYTFEAAGRAIHEAMAPASKT
ncbi:MAG: hypothetical protein IT464_12620 [Planctomycetes bacterium]|nr:hypothetical protein [Planctomycetota bacterium]